MARCMKMQEKYDMAVPMFVKVAELKEKAGKKDAALATVYQDLGECYRATGRGEDATVMESRSEKCMVWVKEGIDRAEAKAAESSSEEEESDDEDEEDDENIAQNN